jgi:hypothetical protein
MDTRPELTAASPRLPRRTGGSSASRAVARAHVFPRRHLALAGLVTSLVVTAAGCSDSGDGSGDEPTAAESWAGDLCSSVGAWTTTIDEARATLANPRELSVTDVQSTIEKVRTSTSTFVSDLGDMGAPDTEAGDAAAQRVSSLSDSLEQQASVMEKAAGTQPDGLEQRLARVSTVSGAAATMASETKKAVSDIRELDGAAELQDAMESSSSCQDLSG